MKLILKFTVFLIPALYYRTIFTGDDVNQSRTRKVVRQSRLEDTIRTVQEPITGPGYKQEPNQVKDKGGGGKDDTQDDEDKKTLAQQVADGKYGLIQNEIFDKRPKRPGIISYEVNPEVPKDNVNNLGGLKPEEIWLAENHLLVLAGGGFRDKEIDRPIWPPIDNYIAPSRQVKIPPNPKVPPPFPVQLKPGGPLEFIKGENGTGGPPPFFPPPDGQFPIPPNASFPYPPPDFNSGNFSLGNGPYPPPPFPFYPPQNGSFFLPPPGFLPPIPPGAAFLPPPGNLTDTFDEDDPSIYYPPPYDFFYPKDNSSLVPPGPLVPGIVLPPPPDFFAPYKNTTSSKSRPNGRPPPKVKTSIRKPTKHKNVQIITSSEGPYNGFTIRPSIGRVNIVTTPPPVIYTSTPPPITTEIYTRRPTIKTTTDNSLNNEITPPTMVHALPPNAVVKGWVPIPAPHPYYITGPRKPLRKGTTTTLPPDYNSVTPPEDHRYAFNSPDYELSVNSWLYPNKSKPFEQEQQFFKVNTESPKQDYFYDDFYLDKNHYYSSSTESPNRFEDQTKLKSIFYPTRSPLSTISPAQLYRSHSENRGKALKTYYFYEEPHISEGKLTDTENSPYPTSAPKHYRNRDPHTITEEIYINTAAKQTGRGGQFKPSPLDYFYPQQEFLNIGSQKASTESPIQYYFAPESANSYNGGPYPPPVTSTPKPNTYTKPPVYEYSFAIPGYGSLEPPKVGMPKIEPYLAKYNYETTPRSHEEYLYTTPAPTTTPTPAYKSPQHDESRYYTTKRPKNVYFTTQRPQVQGLIQTENPYHAFFTHQDAGLIDDITKKYFTTFGQKLNHDSIRGESVTTPLPPSIEESSAKSYYPQTSPRPQFYEPDRPRTRYSQNSAPVAAPIYYTTPRPPANNYPSRVQYQQPIYSQLYDQRPHSSLVSTQKPISLGSDLLVNYKEPLPPLNPDAEFIDPANPGLTKPDQSFISYRLPGNGGHFFFLTPQVAQQQQQFSEYMYGAEHPEPYYKRSTRRPQTIRRNVHSRTS